ncbi:MAG: UbiX family flavin prenyltransferase [Candidatus Andeanibacterium colombiense]|uniref:Flavin prenyltransferase UbiX n=1 Tax=Candidatus Andeanibacterium colombiense TaxID=3121345 RepID=A0AAJ5X8T5_9SPHN|nr:MAG: UbiX family flavin prenyltransferase [Sphingomonadaceae bacterium]
MSQRRMIVAISGASGAIYGIRLLETLRAIGVETHLVVSEAAARTIHEETGMTLSAVRALADVCYPNQDIGAAIASGSFRTDGMIVAPCSIKSASEIACGITSSLLARAADVVLKERRRLVLMLRETPLHLGHLRTLTQLAEIGAIVAPPVPAFYMKPQTLDDIVNHSVGRILDLFDLEAGLVRRWRQDGDGRAND